MTNNQGLFGALWQYWNVNPQPRLERRNTYFEDTTMSNSDALRVGIVASAIAIAIVGFWCILGVIL